MLDPDDISAEHAQLIGRERPSQDVGQVHHPDALERSSLNCAQRHAPSRATTSNTPTEDAAEHTPSTPCGGRAPKPCSRPPDSSSYPTLLGTRYRYHRQASSFRPSTDLR